jgi:hypothetical protein
VGAKIVANESAVEATWLATIRESHALVRENRVGNLAVVVSGSEGDQRFWRSHIRDVATDVFRADGSTHVVSVRERTPKGNLLGTLNAWREVQQEVRSGAVTLPDVGLLSMVFGKGKRLSPFTQALGNCKAALPTPARSATSHEYLRGGDLSSLYAVTWLDAVARAGFRGMIVKWGDEALIPGVRWNLPSGAFKDVDAVRFVWRTEPDEVLAREKEWIVVDDATGLMVTEYSRQELDAIRRRRTALGGSLTMGVNLGSFAISYDLLEAGLDVFGSDVQNEHRAADWDPYGWLALCCQTEADWRREIAEEARAGRTALAKLLERFPDFYEKMHAVRARLEARRRRPLRIGVLDFGACFWVDMGLHSTLRAALDRLTQASPAGQVAREIFGIAAEPDANGNIVIDSQIGAGADIRNSVIVDTTIQDGASVVSRGVIIGGRHGTIAMPEGGAALFCALNALTCDGPSSIALRSVGGSVQLPAGGRHTTLHLPDGPVQMVGSESITNYDGPDYSAPVFGNALSFSAASSEMDAVGPAECDRRWRLAWEAADGLRLR